MLTDIELCHVTENSLYCVVNSVSKVLEIFTLLKKNVENCFCWSPTEYENAIISLRRQKNAVFFYASLTNYRPLET